MSREAYQRAERCFALARSTTFAGEREAAIARGTAIAEKAGLNLDLFDVPGRARANRPFPDKLFEGNGIFGDGFRYANFHSVSQEVADREWAMFEHYWRTVDQSLREREARRQTEDLAAERARRQRQHDENKFRDCLNWLRSRGVAVYRDDAQDEDSYFAPDDGGHVNRHDVVRMARERGWPG